MAVIRLEDIQNLFRKVIVPFHEIERDITLPVASHRPDNDAEHSWSLALLAISLAGEIDAELDASKVCSLAVVHDLVEVYAGDTSVWASEEHLATKADREKKAVIRLKQELPKFNNLFDYVDEYELRETNEAKFVYALDKFLNLLMITEDNGFYYRELRKITKKDAHEKLKQHRIKAHEHPVVARYYDQLKELFDSNPENFYPN